MDALAGKRWIWRTLFVGLLASACHAGVFTEMGDHPNTDVQLPPFQFLNFTLSSATLDREFPQYNYAEQGDLVGYFGFNPARLVIWAPRAEGQLDQNPPESALLLLASPVLGWQSLQVPAPERPGAAQFVHEVGNYHAQHAPTVQADSPPSQQAPVANPVSTPTVIDVLQELPPPPPVVITTVQTGAITEPSAVPEPSFHFLVGITIALAAAMRSSKLLRRQHAPIASGLSQFPGQRAVPHSGAAGSHNTQSLRSAPRPTGQG